MFAKNENKGLNSEERMDIVKNVLYSPGFTPSVPCTMCYGINIGIQNNKLQDKGKLATMYFALYMLGAPDSCLV